MLGKDLSAAIADGLRSKNINGAVFERGFILASRPSKLVQLGQVVAASAAPAKDPVLNAGAAAVGVGVGKLAPPTVAAKRQR